MKKIFLFLIFMSIALTSFAKNNEKRVILAFELYDKGKYEQSIKLIDSVLMSKGEDYETLTELAAANWCLSWIYKNTGYANKDIQKSYQFANTTLNYYNLIVSKYPYYRSQNTRQINDITVEMQELIRDYPGCNNEDAESRNAEKKTENISTENQNTTEKENTDKAVTITVSGSGKTQDEAKQSALRSAIEQAFGAFISSKTEILNDQVISDQITSVASGNIQSFDILNASQLPDGTWGVTLKALVSIDKLTSFVEAKGVTVEIKGGMFALNIKQQLLNEQAEIKAVTEMIWLLHEPMQMAFDYTIKSGEPKSVDSESKNWEIPLTVTATANKNIDFCANYIITTLASLSLSDQEVATYKNLNKAVFPVIINYNDISKTYYLRKENSTNALNVLINQWEFYTRLFTVQSGMDESNGNGKVNIHEFGYREKKGYDYVEKRYEYEETKINFLTAGQQAATFSWQDSRTLTQIEKMSGYTVKPRGVVSKLRHGGFVVYEKDGHGLVAAFTDLGRMDWNSAKTACDELVLNGYNDWRLPTKEELNTLYVYLKKVGVGAFANDFYWSSTEYDNYFAWYLVFDNYNISKYDKRVEYRVRAVRFF